MGMGRVKAPPAMQDAIWAATKATLEARALQSVDRWTPYEENPYGFVTSALREHVWSKQRAILESVRDNRHTAVKSCHGPGKSFIVARIACWWLSVHEPGSAFVVTTAPSYPQVRAILWREMGRAYRKGKLPGRMNQTEWFMGRGSEHYSTPVSDEEMVAFGRKPADTDPTAFQGIHAQYVLVIFDEACGIPKELWDAAEGLITNENSRIIAIGNPDDPASEFAEVCKPGGGWNVITISAFDTPNFTGEPIPPYLVPLLTTPTWVDERKAKWGENSPLYKSKVLGEFPEDSTDGVVPWSWVARSRHAEPPEYAGDDLLPVELGVDVGAGGDLTVVRERRGRVAGRSWQGHTKESTEAVGLVMNAIRETDATRVKIDVIGIGWGVAGRLKELRRDGHHRAEIIEVNVANEPSDKKKYAKLRDEIWWLARERSQDAAWDLSAVDDETLQQLIAPIYKLDSLGRIQVEPKAETIKRLDRSPDDADALNLAYYEPAKGRSKRVMTW